MTPSPFFEVKDLACQFGGVKAVDGISLRVAAGEVVGILGPNGSGKSTLFNLITGIYKPTRGTIELHRTDLTRLAPHQIARLGVARTFQNPRVFGRLDAQKHAVVGQSGRTAEITLRSFLAHLGTPWNQNDAAAALALDRVFSHRLPEGNADRQPYGVKRLLEVARCLSARPQLLLLDEPTAGLSTLEAAELRGLLAGVANDDDLTLLVIDHDVSFLRALCRRVVVIDRGRCIADGQPEVVLEDAGVFDAYFGGVRQ